MVALSEFNSAHSRASLHPRRRIAAQMKGRAADGFLPSFDRRREGSFMRPSVLSNCTSVKAQDQASCHQAVESRGMARPRTETQEPTAFGRRILEAAAAAGFTPTSLARAAKFSAGYMTRLVYKTQSRMDLEYFQRLCELLSVRMEWLAFGREPMREGGPRRPVDEAIVAARRFGVTEDVFWYVRRRDQKVGADRSEMDWLTAFLDESRRRQGNPEYVQQARRIPMSEGETPMPEPVEKPRTLIEPARSRRGRTGT